MTETYVEVRDGLMRCVLIDLRAALKLAASDFTHHEFSVGAGELAEAIS